MMGKWMELTADEAAHSFILHDGAFAPEIDSHINLKLDTLHRQSGRLSVSIVIPTHRTSPDSDTDALLMKKLIIDAERRLNEVTDKRTTEIIMEHIRTAAERIDWRHNLDALSLYANEKFAIIVKLPVEGLDPELTVGRTFDLRPLYKSRQQNEHYYIITVSKEKIRVMEAHNDRVVSERLSDDFPFERTGRYNVKWNKTQEPFPENMNKEFYNDADKSFRQIWNKNPLPVVLAGNVKSIAYYEEQMDNSDPVIARVMGSYDNSPEHEIIRHIYPVIEEYRSRSLDAIREELDKGYGSGLLATDPDAIFEASANGNAAVLYIGNHYSLENKVSAGMTDFIDKDNGGMRLNDLLHLLIRDIQNVGESIVFAPDEIMEYYNGIALLKRYDNKTGK